MSIGCGYGKSPLETPSVRAKRARPGSQPSRPGGLPVRRLRPASAVSTQTSLSMREEPQGWCDTVGRSPTPQRPQSAGAQRVTSCSQTSSAANNPRPTRPASATARMMSPMTHSKFTTSQQGTDRAPRSARPASAGPAREELDNRHGVGASRGVRPASARPPAGRWSVPQGDGRPGYQTTQVVDHEKLRAMETAALEAVDQIHNQIAMVECAISKTKCKMQAIVLQRAAGTHRLAWHQPDNEAPATQGAATDQEKHRASSAESRREISKDDQEKHKASSAESRREISKDDFSTVFNDDDSHRHWWEEEPHNECKPSLPRGSSKQASGVSACTGPPRGSMVARRRKMTNKPWPPPPVKARARLSYRCWQHRERIADSNRKSQEAHEKAKIVQGRAREAFKQRMNSVYFDPSQPHLLAFVSQGLLSKTVHNVQRAESSDLTKDAPHDITADAVGRGQNRRHAVATT